MPGAQPYKIHKTSFRRKYLIPTARQCIYRDENALLWAMGSTLGTLNISVIFLMFRASQAITNAYLNTVDMYNLHLSWKQIPQFIMEESVTLQLCSWMHTFILWALSLTILQLLPFSASHSEDSGGLLHLTGLSCRWATDVISGHSQANFPPTSQHQWPGVVKCFQGEFWHNF